MSNSEESKKLPSGTERIKKGFWFLAKLGLAAGIVLFLFARNRAGILEGFRTFNYFWLLPAGLLYFLHMVFCGYRWYVLTRMLKISLSFREAFSLTMQAYFFSLVVPGGAIGGDLVKIGVLSSRTPAGTKIEGAFSILMDRIVGMVALFLVAIVVTIPAIPVLMQVSIPGFVLNSQLKILGIVGIFLLCLSGIGASAAIFLHHYLERIPPIGFLMRKADELTHGMVRRMTAATDLYRRQWKTLFRCIFWSIPLVHLMTVAVFACLAAGLDARGPGMLVIVAAGIIGNIAGLIPLFPSGIGGRDVVVVTILAAGGMAAGEAKTAQLLYTALLITFNLLGGLFFVFDPGRKTGGHLVAITDFPDEKPAA